MSHLFGEAAQLFGGRYPFRVPLRLDPWPSGHNDHQRCVVCGRTFQPWAGSLLPVHGRCLFHEWAQDAILDADIAESRLAGIIGVSVSVVRAAKKAARRRRGIAGPNL